MKLNYLDRYYNHYSKSLRMNHNQLVHDRDYLMRFNTFLPYSCSKDQKKISIVYSNSSSTMNLVKLNSSSKIKKNHFTILNPNTDWEFFCSEQERIDVLSLLLSEKLMSKFSYYMNSEERKLLDNPFDVISCNSFFVENVYNANYNKTGWFLKDFFNKSNTTEYQLLDPNEIVFEFLNVLYKEQFHYNQGILNIKGKKKSTRNEVFKRIIIAYEYIHDNYESKRININDLTMVSGLSEYHLYSSFKTIFKKTPHQYLNSLRIKVAKQYIDSGRMTISEISDLLLFPDLQSFSKFFRKTYGIAPSKFRKDCS